MDATLKTIVWEQFGAAIDMLDNAIAACPDALWHEASRPPEFWYVSFHTLFFLDLYLFGSEEGFAPPAPFTLDELEYAGVRPAVPYSKSEMRAYLRYGREKCRTTIESLTAETAHARCRFSWAEFDAFELLLYNMRHVQHHAAQLNLLLRQRTDSAPEWINRADPLPR